MQRGRDMGLRSYVEWRVFSNLSQVTSFDELVDHSAEDRQRLTEAYE